MDTNLPFVSVCTPTFNRRPFIGHLIKCFENQDYPRSKMEWIIIDDGTDKIEDLVSNIPEVKYYKYDTKMLLGEKRNLMHTKTKGEIIVYMDDDDYYPPERVSHAVNTLKAYPEALCAGSGEVYVYFKDIDKLYQFGPYGNNHATAGTFAFRRELLAITSYEDKAAFAEESAFLKNYTIPFIQLDPIKTILVISHKHNTFNKKNLLINANPVFVKESNKTVDMFIKEPDMREFYVDHIEHQLTYYTPGSISMKQDVLEQLYKTEEAKRLRAEEYIKHLETNQTNITLTTDSGEVKKLSIEEIFSYLQHQESKIVELIKHINLLNKELTDYKTEKSNQTNELVSNNNNDITSGDLYKDIGELSIDEINQLCIA